MNLSEHFTLEEFTESDTAVRLGIDNTPGHVELTNLIKLATYLELIRTALDAPITVRSAYRCQKLNSATGGADDSWHTKGLAADFIAPAFGTPQQVCKAIIDAEIPFDQLIYEGSWVHVSIGEPLRVQVLTARFTQGKKVSYTEGITV